MENDEVLQTLIPWKFSTSEKEAKMMGETSKDSFDKEDEEKKAPRRLRQGGSRNRLATWKRRLRRTRKSPGGPVKKKK